MIVPVDETNLAQAAVIHFRLYFIGVSVRLSAWKRLGKDGQRARKGFL